MENSRSTKQPDIEKFFHYCNVAAKIIDELPRNTTTRACALFAIRRASNCYAGKNGIRFVSAGALARHKEVGAPWHQLGLIKEHVVPVSLMRKKTTAALQALSSDAGTAPPPFTEEAAPELPPNVAALFQQHPRAWQVGRIVRDWTILAWITGEENARFNDKPKYDGISLIKRMPLDWDGKDPFARYTAAGIELVAMPS